MFSRTELAAAWSGVLDQRHAGSAGVGSAGLEERHAAFLRNESVEALPVMRVPVSKPAGGVRWLDVLDPHEEAVYRAATARVAGVVEARLGRRVLANRVADPSPALRLEPWREARRRFTEAARRMGEGSGAVLVADVRAFFAGIRPEAIEGSLLSMGCHPRAVAALGRILRRLHDRGVVGLPVGPEPSAVLANAVLAGADRAVAEQGCVHVRWVDDFVIATADRRAATRVLGRLSAALSRVGLEVAPQKCRIEEGGAVARVLAGASGTAAG